MSGADEPPATYRFFPYVREGYAPTTGADPLDADVPAPPTLQASVNTKGSGSDGTSESASVTAELDLYGPGEVTGIDERRGVLEHVELAPRDRVADGAARGGVQLAEIAGQVAVVPVDGEGQDIGLDGGG